MDLIYNNFSLFYLFNTNTLSCLNILKDVPNEKCHESFVCDSWLVLLAPQL